MLDLKTIIVLVLISTTAGFFGGRWGASFEQLTEIKITKNTSNSNGEYNYYIEDSSFIEVIEKVLPAVFSIQVSDQNQKTLAEGSAFLISEQGIIITNKHVVEQATNTNSVTYRLTDYQGKNLTSKILSLDPFGDLAILQIENWSSKQKLQYPPLKFSSSKAKIGQRVIAIGNALSEFDSSVNAGIISALNRYISTKNLSSASQEAFSGLIQTDIALNPGNSGGPLVNLKGEIVGMNLAIDKRSKGIAFAIPAKDLQNSLNSFYQNGKIIRPSLNLQFIMLSPDQALRMTGEYAYGAIITSKNLKPDSPASKAGLEFGDIILKIDNKEVNLENPLDRLINEKKAGEKIKLEIYRSPEILTTEATLNACSTTSCE